MKRLYKLLLFIIGLFFLLFLLGLIFLRSQSFQLKQWKYPDNRELTIIPERPNILLLVAEDLSVRIGSFGDEIALTPNIDRLASRGVRYPNTFTTAGVCAPSRAALITGMHQISMGGQHMRTSTRPEGAYKCVPPAEVKAFPELLRKEGYFTFNTSKQDYQFSGAMPGSGPFTIWDEENNSNLWRNRNEGQPFFGMINFMETHESRLFSPLGNRPNSRMHFLMQLFELAMAPRNVTRPEINPEAILLPPYYPDTKAVRNDLVRHYENISIMDQLVGNILDKLEKDGLLENTIVIWTTDHGDGLPRAKRELYDSGIKVPMVIYYPPAFLPSNIEFGSVDKRLISFVDLAPTILSLTKTQVPEFIHGQNFLEQDNDRNFVFASRDRIDEVQDRQRAVRNKRYKYLRSWYPELPGGHPLKFRDNIEMMKEMWELKSSGKLDEDQLKWFLPPGEELLFDLDNDPHELNNIALDRSYSKILDSMRVALNQWLESIEDWSEVAENEMVSQFLDNGKIRITHNPKFKEEGDFLIIEASPGSSIGYQLEDGQWKLYSQALDLTSIRTVQAKAIRYGWKESEVVSYINSRLE